MIDATTRMSLNALSSDLTEKLMPWVTILVIGIILLWFKDFVNSIVKGMTFRLNQHFRPGQIVYLDGEKALIISIGLRQTIFERTNEKKEKTWEFVSNELLTEHKLERIIDKTPITKLVKRTVRKNNDSVK